MTRLSSDGPLRVLVARAVFPDIIDPLRDVAEVETTPDDAISTPETLRQRLADKHGAFITGSERIDAALLDACPQLKVVSTMTVGVDHIDLAACAERGVTVTHAPDVLTDTTADFGFALLLAAARQVGDAERYLRAGQWTKWSVDLFAGADVHGATLGIVGMGRIGQAIARRAALGFKMRVVYHNRKRLPVSIEEDLHALAAALFRDVALEQPVRLIGFGVTGLTERAGSRQLDLFDLPVETRAKKENLDRAVDRIREAHGADAIRRARNLPRRPPRGGSPRP